MYKNFVMISKGTHTVMKGKHQGKIKPVVTWKCNVKGCKDRPCYKIVAGSTGPLFSHLDEHHTEIAKALRAGSKHSKVGTDVCSHDPPEQRNIVHCIHCALCIVHCALCTVHCLRTYPLCTVCVSTSIHCALYVYPLCSVYVNVDMTPINTVHGTCR